jgi:hypothetical protein
MSDETNITPKSETTKVTRKPARVVPFSSIHVTVAKSKGIDVTRAAKLNRSYIRSNFDAIAKVWPELRKSQKANRDGNRYPTVIPTKVAEMIVKRTVPASRAK